MTSPPQFPLVAELEWLDAMTQFDTNAIHDLLYDPTEEIAQGAVSSEPGLVIQDCEAVNEEAGPADESFWCLDGIRELDWPDVAVGREVAPAMCYCVGDWYGDSCMEGVTEVFEMGDYWFSNNVNSYDEIGYIGLWQENLE